ncbi:hypothetical protein IAR50_007254 [Cryptococcus sp. DSM 104548]
MSCQTITATTSALPMITNASDGAFRILQEVEPTIFHHLADIEPVKALLICKAYYDSTKARVYREVTLGTAMVRGHLEANPGIDDSAPRRLIESLQHTRIMHVDDGNGLKAYEGLLNVVAALQEPSTEKSLFPALKRVVFGSDVARTEPSNVARAQLEEVAAPLSESWDDGAYSSISLYGNRVPSYNESYELVANLRWATVGCVWSSCLFPANSHTPFITEIYHVSLNDVKAGGSLPIFQYGVETASSFITRQLVVCVEPPKEGEKEDSQVFPALKDWLQSNITASQAYCTRASEGLGEGEVQPKVTIHVPFFASMSKAFYKGKGKVQMKQLNKATCEAYGLWAEYAW